ncbi:DUF58 domain-containing protein [Allorhizocola rhizosphaerae]|uniref:DUF58 domain-containing protein n=1 Tax=Allorhizocola rhizosphaerae TaxID=1872709 RepID=UPI000E3D8BE6|nr:DUF58 domain-containing protein [Allorhizocola rhizosphaerae]
MTAPHAILNRLHLLVSRRLDGLLQGDYLGLLPGSGSEAGESREYVPGDDVRRMDWPVTARTTVPHVRLTVADRELETWLAVDLSPSLDFGTARMLKRDLALAASAAIIHLTVRGGNRAGAVFGDLKVRPARGGRLAAQALLKAISQERGTARLSGLINALHRPVRRRGLAVVISDFLDPPEQWAWPLRRLAARHDVLAIEIVDPRELELPDVGVLELVDPESGQTHGIRTSGRMRDAYAVEATAQRATIERAIRDAGAHRILLRTDSDWLLDLVRYVAAQRHRHRLRR